MMFDNFFNLIYISKVPEKVKLSSKCEYLNKKLIFASMRTDKKYKL